MIVKFTRKEILKLFKWRARRKIKKHEKRKEKDESYKKFFNEVVDELDYQLAYGMSKDEWKKLHPPLRERIPVSELKDLALKRLGV
ncbi:hypothetical protein LCGC14_1031220 [marine sediment metagenome]|uniref:Uncharacterized protein n=1 Tax=marine sediment metagenome TaxID=412755 RepID=A0A0F9R0H5_9ZZZZ